MLTQLHVQNLATLASVDLDLPQGCIAITGDTGAGKSLILEALELALGGRSDAGLVRAGTEKAQVTASFDIQALPEAKAWLIDNELDDNHELILRRTLTAEGRSKAYVNGTPISANQLKELSEQLVFMHTQHANLKLLQTRHQLALVDAFADGGLLANECRRLFQDWKTQQDVLNRLVASAEKADQERELLAFQVEEFKALNLSPGEFEALDLEQKQLASSEAFLRTTGECMGHLSGEDGPGVIGLTERMATDLLKLGDDHPALKNAAELLNQAAIALDEAKQDIQHAVDRFEIDPERLQWVEERLATLFSLARKHRIEPEGLLAHQAELEMRLDAISGAHERIPQLQAEVEALKIQAEQCAMQLSEARRLASESLSGAITAQFPDLGMPHAQLTLRLIPQEELSAQGFETVQFFFQPNPGQQGGVLSKIASGGELSRVSLAIQVISAARLATPTVVFDEVDVGIGGKTAATVGQLLKRLAANAQVLVVTHQPQVAGQASAHLHVSKQASGDVTVSEARLLNEAERIEEIARMLGGHEVTEATLAAARDLRVSGE